MQFFVIYILSLYEPSTYLHMFNVSTYVHIFTAASVSSTALTASAPSASSGYNFPANVMTRSKKWLNPLPARCRLAFHGNSVRSRSVVLSTFAKDNSLRTREWELSRCFFVPASEPVRHGADRQSTPQHLSLHTTRLHSSVLAFNTSKTHKHIYDG